MKTTSIITVDSPLGLNQSWGASAPSAYEAINLRHTSRGSWREAGGLIENTLIGTRSEAPTLYTDVTVETMHWWSQHNGARRWLMFEFSHDAGKGATNTLCVVNPRAPGGYEVLESNRTYKDGPWQRTQYVANGGWVYWLNGYQAPKRWDGRGSNPQRPVRVGFDRVPLPPQVSDSTVDFNQEDRTCRPIGFMKPPTLLPPPLDLLGSEMYVYMGQPLMEWLVANAGWYVTPPVTVLADQQRGVGTAHAETFPNPLWKYGYAITHMNDLGMESPLSELTFVNGGNDNQRGKRQVAIQVQSALENVVAIRIYRTVNLRFAESSYRREDTESDGLGNSSTNYTYEINYKDGAKLDAYSYEAFRPLNERINVQNRQDFQVFLLDTIDTGASVQYVDDTPDNELGPLFNPANVGLFPRGAKYMAMFKGTMFVAGSPEYPDRVFFSAPLYCEQFPPSNFMQIGDRDSGEVTGLCAMEDTMVCFKQRGIYLIKGNVLTGYTTHTLTEEMGCSSPNAVVATPMGLVFVTPSGIYPLSGIDNSETAPTIRHISKPIQKYWDEHVFTQGLMSAQATVNYQDQEVWVQVPADGSWHPSVGLVWHYGVGSGEWTRRRGYPANCFAQSRDEYQNLYVGSWDPSLLQANGGIRVYNHATPTRADQGDATYMTSWLSFGNRYDRTMVIHFQPIMVDFGGTNARLPGQWYSGRDLVAVSEETLQLTNSETDQQTWDNAVWGTDFYGDYRSSIFRFDTTNNGSPLMSFESAFELSGYQGGRFELIAYDLEVTPSRAPVDIKKLTPAKV